MKETKIGHCIEDFSPIRLKDFLILDDAGRWGNNPKEDGSDKLVVRSTNFNETGFLDLTDVAARCLSETDWEKTKLEENDILIERSGGSANQPVGRVSLITKEIAETGFGFSNFIQRIRVSNEHDPKFIFYCLYQLHSAGLTQTMQTQTNGIRNLEYRYYLSRKFPNPLKPEQTQIAHYLSTVDRAIETTQTSIEKLEKLKKSLMQNLLTGKLKPDGTWRRDDEFYSTQRGKLPKGWRWVKIKQISETYSGATPSRGNDNFYRGSIPWVKSGEVNSPFIFDTEEKISFDAFNSSSTKWVPSDTILFAMYGATAGKISLLKIKACTNQAVLAIPIKDPNSFDRDFVALALEQKVPYLISICQGSGQPNLSKSIIDKSLIATPEKLEVQSKIAMTIQRIVISVEAKRSKIDQYKNLKKSLMQNLLTGKIRLPEFAQTDRLVPSEKIKNPKM